MRSTKKLAAEKRQEMQFLSSEEKEIWIEDYVVRGTAGVRQRVEAAEAAIKHAQEVTETAEISGLTTREHKKMFHEMICAIRDSLSDISSSDDGEDGEDEHDEETEQRKLSDDDGSGWVMGTRSKMVQYCREMFRPKQMKLDELTQPGSGEAADDFRERDKMYSTSELRAPAVVKPQMAQDVAAPPLTAVGGLIEYHDIVPGRSQIPQGTSWPRSSHMRLGSGKPQSDSGIPSLAPAMELDSSPMLDSKPIEPGSFYPCI